MSSISSTATASPSISRPSILPSAKCWCGTTGGRSELNRRQAARLKALSEYCTGEEQEPVHVELLSGGKGQLESLDGDRKAYDLTLRPRLMAEAIEALQDAGVEPDVWKIEGLESRADCENVVAAARRQGRNQVAASSWVEARTRPKSADG